MPSDPEQQAVRIAAGATRAAVATGKVAAISTSATQAHEESAGTAGAARCAGPTLAADAAVTEDSGRAAVATGDAGFGAVPAGTPVAEPQTTRATNGIGFGTRSTVADQELPESCVEESVDLFAGRAVDPRLRGHLQRGVDVLLKYRRPV